MVATHESQKAVLLALPRGPPRSILPGRYTQSTAPEMTLRQK
jgi:hypothetical protein